MPSPDLPGDLSGANKRIIAIAEFQKDAAGLSFRLAHTLGSTTLIDDFRNYWGLTASRQTRQYEHGFFLDGAGVIEIDGLEIGPPSGVSIRLHASTDGAPRDDDHIGISLYAPKGERSAQLQIATHVNTPWLNLEHGESTTPHYVEPEVGSDDLFATDPEASRLLKYLALALPDSVSLGTNREAFVSKGKLIDITGRQ